MSHSCVRSFTRRDMSPSCVRSFTRRDTSPSCVGSFTRRDTSPSCVGSFTRSWVLQALAVSPDHESFLRRQYLWKYYSVMRFSGVGSITRLRDLSAFEPSPNYDVLLCWRFDQGFLCFTWKNDWVIRPFCVGTFRLDHQFAPEDRECKPLWIMPCFVHRTTRSVSSGRWGHLQMFLTFCTGNGISPQITE